MKTFAKKFLAVFVSFTMALAMIPLSGGTTFAETTYKYKKITSSDSINTSSEYLIVYESGSTKVALNNKGDSSSNDTPISITSRDDGDYDIETVSDNMLWRFGRDITSTTTSNVSINNSVSGSLGLSYNGSINSDGNSLTIYRNNDEFKIYKTSRLQNKYYLVYRDGKFKVSSSDNNNSMTIYERVEVQEETTTEQPVASKPFRATMYNFDGGTFNTATKNLTGNNTDKFYFTGTSDANTAAGSDRGSVSKYNAEAYLVQGIVKNELSDGNIVFNDNAKNAGVFAPSNQTVAGRTVYENVQFPFKYEGGYYTFDSKNNHVHVSDLANNNNSLLLYSGSQTMGGKGTFFPFNDEGDTSADYHFGMNMSIPFYMNEYGTVDGTQSGEAVTFDFSGDDDVWVFINGKLVLDIGGIHGAIGASINFKTGDISYSYQGDLSASEVTGTNISGGTLTTTTTLSDLGISMEDLALDENNLQIYYLERGAGASNCKIKFNLLTKDSLEVSKSLGLDTPYTTSDFKFKLLYSETEGGTYTEVENTRYRLYTGSVLDKNNKYQTNANGEFSIKAGQRAVFVDNPVGYYKVVEITDGYDTSWTTKKDGTTLNTASNTDTSPIVNITQVADGSKTRYSIDCSNSTDFTLSDDYIVLDFGKSIKYDIRANDSEQSKADGITLCAIGNNSLSKDKDNLASDYKTVSENSTADANLANGNIKISDAANGIVTYTPTKYMNSIDKANYVVSYTIQPDPEVETKETKYKYATINVLPATSVYYEDNFGTINDNDTTNGIVFSGAWDSTEETAGKDSEQNNDGYVYGTDSSYNDDSKYSNGSAMKIESTEEEARATFTFKGTGVEVYSRTDNNTGKIKAYLYEGKGDNKVMKKLSLINNTYESDSPLYQIPTIKFNDLTYGEYTVEIVVKGTNYYLDGIRVYNPMGEDQEANKIYDQDDEDNALVEGLREHIIDASEFESNPDATLNGAVFIDRLNADTAEVATYKDIGPKNEVYLSPGKSIAFTLTCDYDKANGGNVQIGMKAPTGTPSQVTINNDTNNAIDLNSATDMYYKISPASDGTVVITNTGNAMVSLTKIKVTKVNTAKTTSIEMVSNQQLLSAARALYVEESSGDTDNTEDNTGDNTGGDTDNTEDNTGDNTGEDTGNTDDSQENISNILDKINSYLKDIFGKLFG